MDVGNTPVDPAYQNVTRHAKMAIPWVCAVLLCRDAVLMNPVLQMEDDPGLTAPEIWLNRTLDHMEEAAQYNCSGLLGIHWSVLVVPRTHDELTRVFCMQAHRGHLACHLCHGAEVVELHSHFERLLGCMEPGLIWQRTPLPPMPSLA
jgi:hypothetical protein